MNRYYLEITVRTDLDGTHVEGLFDRLADAVFDLTDGVIDADLGARLDEGEFDFTMSVDADDESAALTTALSAVRCAIHAAGGATPGWEKHFEYIQHVVRPDNAAA